MIRDNQRLFNRIHVILDMLVIAGTYILAWYIKFEWFNDENTVLSLTKETYYAALVFLVPAYAVLYYAMGLYQSKRYCGMFRESWNIIEANAIGLGIFIAVLYVLKKIDFSRSMFAIFYCISTLLEIVSRIVLRTILKSLRKKGYNIKHIILIGYSRACEKYISLIQENPQWGYVVCGVLDDRIPAGTMYKGVKVLGRIDNIDVILPENKLDEIGISLALKDYDRLEELVRKCEKSGVHTKFIPDYNSVIPSKPYIEDLAGLAVVNIRHVPLTNNINIAIKRIMDIIGSIICLILFSPIMILSAIIIKLSDGGPVFFVQERVGLHNKTFKMYKFRSMRIQTEDEEKKGWSRRGDDRVTSFGKLIRKTSIDELPQMINVLKGDMSLIGPRPERPQFVEQFKEHIPRYMIKHQVRPGVTGWAQVNGYRGNTSIRKRIEYDLYYIENWTFLFDVKILILTLFKGFINKNAY